MVGVENTGDAVPVLTTRLPDFKKMFWVSAAVHAFLILAVVVAGKIASLQCEKVTGIIFIPAAPRGQLTAGPAVGFGEAPRGNNPNPAAAASPPAAPTPRAAIPAPTPTSPQPQAATQPSTTSHATTQPTRRPTRQAQASNTPRQPDTAARSNDTGSSGAPRSSLNDIRRQLMAGLKSGGTPGVADGAVSGTGVGARGTPAGGGTGRGRVGDPQGSGIGVPGGSGPGTPFWDYYVHIHDAMYAAWEQPSQFADPLRPPTARVRLRITKDGSLLAAELAHSSGVREVDESALSAARSARLNPPPDSLLKGKDFVEITIAFKLGGQG